MEAVMLADPTRWQGHYSGDEAALFAQRHFGLADRIRYYWPQPQAVGAGAGLFGGLGTKIPCSPFANRFYPIVFGPIGKAHR